MNENQITPRLDRTAEVMHSTYSYDIYEGHNNEQIISLHSELNDAMSDIKRIEKEIDLIQSTCAHEYLWSSGGAYKDNYVCRKCGHETEH